MRIAVKELLVAGQTLELLLEKLDGHAVGDGHVRARVDTRARPYLDHEIVAWTDGPPSSNVVAFIAGRDPNQPRWRRFTLTHTGPWMCEIDAFPTPFNNPEAPLAPGIPPSASRPIGSG
jgi:hypothetical protein